MKPVEPPLHEGGRLIIFAKNQPPYIPLPASVDAEGTVMSQWEFSEEDLLKIMAGGNLRLWILHTEVLKGKPLTPVALEIVEPECGFGETNGSQES